MWLFSTREHGNIKLVKVKPANFCPVCNVEFTDCTDTTRFIGVDFHPECFNRLSDTEAKKIVLDIGMKVLEELHRNDGQGLFY